MSASIEDVFVLATGVTNDAIFEKGVVNEKREVFPRFHNACSVPSLKNRGCAKPSGSFHSYMFQVRRVWQYSVMFYRMCRMATTFFGLSGDGSGHTIRKTIAQQCQQVRHET